MLVLTHNHGDVEVHGSHRLIRDGLIIECRDCRLCPCHGRAALARPCEATFYEHEHPVHVVTSIVDQAYRYGEQVRLLEDAGLEEARESIRRAWMIFRRQFGGVDKSELGRIAREAYYKAYCL